MFVTESHALTVPLATSERLLSGGMKENPNTKEVYKYRDEKNSLYMHLKDNPDHLIGWEKVSFLACDSNTIAEE